jgi:type 1 glutamine amidotransferase
VGELAASGAAGGNVATVNALRCSFPLDRHRDWRAPHGYRVRDDQLDALAGFVEQGGGLLVSHAAVISFDGRERWRELCGGTWDWDRSWHPPAGPTRVAPTDAGRRDELTVGLEPFEVVDEVYRDLELHGDVEPLLVAEDAAGRAPVLWRRRRGRGRMVTDLLGHDVAALRHPAHRLVLARCLRWLADPCDRTIPAGREHTRQDEGRLG